MMEDEFEGVHWPKLREAVDTVMLGGEADGEDGFGGGGGGSGPSRISFEQMYSSVYKCVCRQQSEALYRRLMEHVAKNLLRWKARLDDLLLLNRDVRLVEEFDNLTCRYFRALSSIVPIFTYLNRFYVATKLDTDIQTELLKLYGTAVADAVVQPVVKAVAELKQTPFSVSPAVVNSLLGNLHKINPNYSQLDPDLFSSHLSGIRTPMVEADLESQRAADRRLLQQLRESGFETGGSGARKRCINDLYVTGGES